MDGPGGGRGGALFPDPDSRELRGLFPSHPKANKAMALGRKKAEVCVCVCVCV